MEIDAGRNHRVCFDSLVPKISRYNAGKFSRLASRASNVNLNIRIQTSVRVHRSRGRSIKGGKETKRYAHTLDSLNKQFDDFAAVLSKSSQFPSCFRHSFFFFFFFLSFFFYFTVIFEASVIPFFVSRNFEPNRPNVGCARNSRISFMLNEESRKYIEKKEPISGIYLIAFDYFKQEVKQRKISRCFDKKLHLLF